LFKLFHTFCCTIVPESKKNETILISQYWYYWWIPIRLSRNLAIEEQFLHFYITLYQHTHIGMSGGSHYYIVVNIGHQQMALETNAQNHKNDW